MIRRSELEEVISSQTEQIKRQQTNEIERFIDDVQELSGFARIITGIRRCGKSTIMIQIMRRTSERRNLYLNFDDIRLSNFEKADFSRLFEIISNGAYQAVFFDEIQLIQGWEIFIHQLLREGYIVYITGSNASLMSSELGTHLTGRHLSSELFPFSYSEYLIYTQQASSYETMATYLRQGGMPEYLRTENTQVLSSLVDDILIRDIAVRKGIRDITSLKQLALYLLTNVTKLFSATNLSKSLGIKSPATILEYIDYMRDAYLMDIVGIYSTSLKVTSRNAKKIYAIDNGIITALSLSGSADSGRLLENFVYICLRKQHKGHIYYFNHEVECDFIITDINNHVTEAIQVCYDLNEGNFEREIHGLREAMHSLNLSKGMLLTMNEQDKLVVPEGQIDIVPVHQFCLQSV